MTEFNADRIYLVGMMGVGKTTLGKRLANAMHYTFMDLDKEIERVEGKSIEQIFEQNGEAYFRKKERDCLLRTQLCQNIVIATGGGTPAYADNMAWMNGHGKTLYLKADMAFVLSRLAQKANKRPLLKGKSEEEMSQIITELFTKRKPLYEQALRSVEIPLENLRELIKSIV
jgi:shikimate kinase